MDLTIKQNEEVDEVQLRELISLCHVENSLLNLLKSTRLILTVSAHVNNQLVGIIIVWTSSFHPFCMYFRILSHPFYRGWNIEHKLLSELKTLNIGTYPFQTSIWETAIHLKTLFETNNFHEIRRTYMPNINVQEIKKLAPFNAKKDKLNITTLHELIKNRVLMDKLLHLVRFIYEQTHIRNPVAKMDLNEWENILLNDDVILDGSYICLSWDSKDILAYSFLHESNKDTSLELGWCGCKNKQDKKLLQTLVLKQIDFAAEQGFQFIEGEFDTTDEYAMELLISFPFEPSPIWITYQSTVL